MAIIKRPPHDDGPVNAGEKRLLDLRGEKRCVSKFGRSENI